MFALAARSSCRCPWPRRQTLAVSVLARVMSEEFIYPVQSASFPGCLLNWRSTRTYCTDDSGPMDQTEHKVVMCKEIIGHDFQDMLLCLEALQTTGYHLWFLDERVFINKNDRLAVLGDAVSRVSLCQRWLNANRTKGEILAHVK